MTTAIIFTANGCQQCKATDRALRRAGWTTTLVDAEENQEEFLETFEGSRQLPGVLVHDSEGRMVDGWTGFRPDLIRKHTHEGVSQ